MPAPIYFSYALEDRDAAEKLVSYVKDPYFESLNFSVVPLFERWETKNKTVIQNYVAHYLKIASRVIVLVGEKTGESAWVEAELELAREFKKPIYAMKLKDRKPSIPSILIEDGVKVEDWDIEVLQYLATK